MTFQQVAKMTENFLTRNSPAILTGIGVAGTLTTAYLSSRASVKAANILELEENERHDQCGIIHHVCVETTTLQKFQLVWKEYIPAAGMAALTITAIILANQIGARRAAAVAAAYSISEQAFEEYRKKVSEKIGASKEQNVRDEVAQDRVNNNPVNSREVIITGGGEVLCCDMHTGRYFKSDMATLMRAQNDLNAQVLNDMYASLTDFYNLIGLKKVAESDDIGWNSDKLLKLEFSTALAEDGQPCLTVTFKVTPIKNFYRVN